MIKKYFLLIILLFSQASFGLEDSLMKSLEISASGNRFQSERIKIAAENLANEESTSSQPGGNPYRRKVVFAKSVYNKKLK